MIKTPIHNFLQAYSNRLKNIRCHMPGSKGRYKNCINYASDITEIHGAGNLYENHGIISKSESIASSLFGSKTTIYSAGGSTLAIQTMLSLLKKINGCSKKILASRYSHKSLINTAVLLGLEVEFIYPEEFLSARINPEVVKKTISNRAEEIAGIFLTSIDYYGGVCELQSISRITEKYRIPLLIDNAHGAYLVFCNNHPLKFNACMVCDSAHKTLPALTGAAYLHIGDSEWSDALIFEVKREIALFGSSSPSYPVLESLDLCNKHISEEQSIAENAFFYVDELKKRLTEIGYTLKHSDNLRITINARNHGYNGFQLAKELRNAHPLSIECEMCDENYVVLLFSTITKEWETDGAAKIMESIPKKKPIPFFNIPMIKPQVALPPRKAYFSINETIPLEKSVSRICTEINAPCPPGVPLIMPGEIFDKDVISTLSLFGVKNVQVIKE